MFDPQLYKRPAKNEKVTVMLTADQLAYLELSAEANGMTRSNFMAALLQMYQQAEAEKELAEQQKETR